MMTSKQNLSAPVVLMVDDDDEDVYLTKRAFASQLDSVVFNSVAGGKQFFEFLNREGEFKDIPDSEMPNVVLLDINIPRENGFEILEKLKSDPVHGHLPVVMLTTSTSENDVRTAYKLGASSFICKSVNSKEMKKIADHFCQYWFGFARLPSGLGHI